MQRVIVKWLDAMDSPQTWMDQEDAERFGDEDCLIESIGYLVKQTAKYVTICGDIAPDKDLGCVRKIPKSMLVSLEIIDEPSNSPPAVNK